MLQADYLFPIKDYACSYIAFVTATSVMRNIIVVNVVNSIKVFVTFSYIYSVTIVHGLMVKKPVSSAKLSVLFFSVCTVFISAQAHLLLLFTFQNLTTASCFPRWLN